MLVSWDVMGLLSLHDDILYINEWWHYIWLVLDIVHIRWFISSNLANTFLEQVFYYFQMILLFFGPESGWISWLSFINFNILGDHPYDTNATILIWSYITSYWIWATDSGGCHRTIADMAECAISMVINQDIAGVSNDARPYYSSIIISLYLIMYVLVHASMQVDDNGGLQRIIDTSIATCVWEYFTCVDVTATETRMKSFPAISCTSPSYNDVYSFFVFMAVMLTLVPLITFAVLIRNDLRGLLANDIHRLRYGVL